MKKSNSICLFLFLFNTMCFVQSSAHDSPVHQHVVKQAYYYLEVDKGVIPELRDRIGLNFYGYDTDDDMWRTGYVGVGAWQVDRNDPVWLYGLSNEWSPTSCHFWDSDAGDDAKTPIPGAGDAFNAYTTARVYLFGNGGQSIFFAKTAIAADLGGITILGRLYRWNSITEFYRTGRCVATGYMSLGGIFTPYPWGESEVNLDLSTARRYAMMSLGRAAHLLEDMCVPAHTHADMHGGPYSSDPYEDYMAAHYQDQFIDGIYGQSHYDAVYARRQGPLLDVYKSVPSGDPNRIVRYLFYTANEIANRFPSQDAEGDLRYQLSYGNDDYSVLNMIQGITHSTSRNVLNVTEVNDYTFRYCIRATAALLYWFATESGILNRVTVLNSFNGGALTVDGQSVSSGYVKGVNGSAMMTVVAPTNPQIDGCNYIFTGWQQIDASGIVIASSSSPTWTTSINGKCSLRANYINPLKAVVSGPGTLQYGTNGTYTASATGGTPPYNYAWWIQYTGTGGYTAHSTQGVKPNRPAPGPTWYAVGSNSPTWVHQGLENFACKCVVVDAAQSSQTSNILNVTITGGGGNASNQSNHSVAAPESSPACPTNFELKDAFPNPFNPSTEIGVGLPSPAHVRLAIYDVLGREVVTLINSECIAGYQTVTWNASSQSSGVYFAQLIVTDEKGGFLFARMNKLLLVK